MSRKKILLISPRPLRDKVFTIRLTQQERVQIDTLAFAYGVSPTHLTRQLVINGIDTLSKKAPNSNNGGAA